MGLRYLVDTNIIVDVFRGHPPAIGCLDSLKLNGDLTVSVIVEMELLVGSRSKKETATIEQFFERDFTVFQLSASVGKTAHKLLLSFSNSHGLRVFDALIAATAIEEDCHLVTRNVKHFRMIPELKIVTPPY